jgi:hypothetical protein
MTKDEIIGLYVNSKMSIKDISKITPQSVSGIRLILKRAGVLRTLKEALLLAKPKLGSGNRGKKIIFTPDRCENCRIAALKRWEKTAKGISLKPSGYYEITRGRDKNRPLHDVIMEIHIGRKLRPGEIVHHINEIKTDNEISNLQLMTSSEHSAYHGILNYKRGNCYDISSESKKGEHHNNAKLSESDVLKIYHDSRMYGIIAKEFNVTISCIKHIKHNRTWKHLKK